MIRLRRSSLAPLLALALMANTLGCASQLAAQSDRPAVKFYAAVEDYNTAKYAALEFVRMPSTSLAVSEKILAVVERADAEVLRLWSLTSTPTAGNYGIATSALRLAQTELRRIVGVKQ
jgi:hypothetical protein